MNPVEDFLNYWREGKGPANDNASKMQEYHAQKSDDLATLECDAYKLARLTKTKTGFSLSFDDVQAHKLWENTESLKSQIASCEKDIAEFIKISGGDFGLDTISRLRKSLQNRQISMRRSIASAIEKGEIPIAEVAGRELDLISDLRAIDDQYNALKLLTNKYCNLVE